MQRNVDVVLIRLWMKFDDIIILLKNNPVKIPTCILLDSTTESPWYPNLFPSNKPIKLYEFNLL